MYRLNSRLLYARTPMLQRPLNQRMIQARRSYSSTDESKGGKGLTWVALLALAAGGYIFFTRREAQPPPLSDPYQRTKDNLSQLSDKVSQVGSDINKEYGDDLSHQVGKVGEHLKSTAAIATDAAKTAYKDLKDSSEVEALVDSIKDETAKLSHELKTETDKFRAEHHLKEGDRPADDIVAHTHSTSAIFEPPRVSVSGKKLDANEAAFDAASKLGNAVSEKVATVKHAAETKFKSPITNPMVDEKRSAGTTKTPAELKLEDRAKHVVHDTSILVEKDTEKVKDLWQAKKDSNEFTYGSNQGTADSSWQDLKEGAKDAWRETKDQAAQEADRLKKTASASYNDLKHDAQHAFRNETVSAKEAWEDVKGQASSEADRLHKKATTTYNDLKHDAQDVFRSETLTAKEPWDERSLKREASDALDDLTNKAKKKQADSWTSLKENVKEDANQLLNKVEDATSHVTGRYKEEASKASAEWDKTQREAQAKAGELKRNATNAARDLKKDGKSWISEDAEWAEKKVDEVKHWAQESVEDLKGNLKHAQEKISEGLKGQDHSHLKPAEVVVEDAKHHKI